MAVVEWIDKAEALRRLGGISERTLERMVYGDVPQIESRFETRPGRRPERLYSAASVERMAHDRTNGNGNGKEGNEKNEKNELSAPAAIRLAPPLASLTWPPELLELLKALTQKQLAPTPGEQQTQLFPNLPPPVLLSEKLWLSYAEAREYSGLPIKVLRRMAHEGKLTVLRGRIRRVSLEEYGGE